MFNFSMHTQILVLFFHIFHSSKWRSIFCIPARCSIIGWNNKKWWSAMTRLVVWWHLRGFVFSICIGDCFENQTSRLTEKEHIVQRISCDIVARHRLNCLVSADKNRASCPAYELVDQWHAQSIRTRDPLVTNTARLDIQFKHQVCPIVCEIISRFFILFLPRLKSKFCSPRAAIFSEDGLLRGKHTSELNFVSGGTSYCFSWYFANKK